MSFYNRTSQHMSFYNQTSQINLNFKMIVFLYFFSYTMVGKRERTSTRQSWDEEAMRNAIDAVKGGQMGWLKAAKLFNVPQATLRRRANDINKRAKGCAKILGRFSTTFSEDEERDFVEHILLLESRLFGITTTEIKKLAFEFATKNGIPNRFKARIAGREWLRGFRMRHPEISLRQPETVSAARAMAFNRPQVQKFFNTLEMTLEKEKIGIDRIYNMDESGLSTVQRPPKIFAKTGRKQVGSLTSAERGHHVTCVCCMNGVGNFVPPALIFPRKNRKQELLDALPPGSLGLFHETGWMTADTFVLWLEHFQNFVKASLESKVLLLLDGHTSHKSLKALTFAKSNGIIMLCFPAHCTHRMQPLDVCFYGPLKTFYNQDCALWLKNHPGRVITQNQIGELFTSAYGKAATIRNATSGFSKTGICPFNPNIFPDEFFEPAETTDRDDWNQTIHKEKHLTNQKSQSAKIEESMEAVQREQDETRNEENDAIGIDDQGDFNTEENPPLKKRITLQEISPLPMASGTRKRKIRQTITGVLTTTPNLEELKQKEEKKRRGNVRQCKRNILSEPSSISQTESEEEEDPFAAEDNEDDVVCLYCNDLFRNSRSREPWISCMKCNKWAHCECAGVSQRLKKFICEICRD